ncbi:MAG TPA: cytochrome c-type biogenesis protein [Burkholderiaceae bacterium]|nr:cytochrome c-type biogenesis protein [Burkholderiaceae bacterium]
MRRTLAALMLALLAGVTHANDATPTLTDPVTAKREVELAAQLRCLVCQNQSIAESHADLAADLRNQVREQIAAGKTDAEIIDYMTARYGDFVRYKPPFKATTLLLWLGPALLLMAGLLVATRIVRARRTSAVPALSPQDHARVEQLLAGTDKDAPRS